MNNSAELLKDDDFIESPTDNEEITQVDNSVQPKNILEYIDKLHQYISTIDNRQIQLLRNKQVIQWIFNDLTFLLPFEPKIIPAEPQVGKLSTLKKLRIPKEPSKEEIRKHYKKQEDNWGHFMTWTESPWAKNY